MTHKTKITDTDFDKWYNKNKDKLSAKRKLRYQTDPEYRQKALDEAAKARALRAAGKVKEKLEGYPYSQLEAAAVLGVTAGTVREWMNKKYFPRPRLFKRRFVFSTLQVDLLEKLKSFLRERGTKTGVNSPEFEDLKAFIAVNWSPTHGNQDQG